MLFLVIVGDFIFFCFSVPCFPLLSRFVTSMLLNVARIQSLSCGRLLMMKMGACRDKCCILSCSMAGVFIAACKVSSDSLCVKILVSQSNPMLALFQC